MKQLFALLLLLVMTAFSSSGFISMNDPKYFKESPQIVTKDGRYFLRFRYSDTHIVFYMVTSSRIEKTKLVYYIPVTTSTGNPRGKLQLEEIISPEKLALAKQDSVFWEEPNKQLLRLPVTAMQEEPGAAGEGMKQH